MEKGFKVLLWLEGNIDSVYKDHAGYNTVCMGIRTKDAVGTYYGMEKCHPLNIAFYNKFRRAVKESLNRTIEDHQLDAFTLFAYNIGINGFRKSSALKAFNRRSPDYLVAANMQKWNKSTIDGVKDVDRVLVKRRSLEAAMFQSAHYHDKAEYLAAKGAPRATSPDSDGLLSLYKKSKTNWASSAVGIMGGGATFFSKFLEKIHPLTINFMMLTVFILAIYLVYNRCRDARIGEHF